MRSLKSRFSFMLGGAFALLILVGLVGVYSTYKQVKIGESAAISMVALRSQMQADMMHDAIRGDVLNAMRLSAEGNSLENERKSVEDDLALHLASFQKQIAFVDAQHIDVVNNHLKDLRKDIDAYEQASRTAVKAALSSKEEGKAAWTSFDTKFKVLEESMAKFGDTIEKLADDAKEASSAQGSKALLINISVVILGGIALLFWGLRTIRDILTQLGGEPADAAELVRAVTSGNLSVRADLKEGDESSLLASMNALSERISLVIKRIRTVAQEQNAGHLSVRIESQDLPGEFATLANEVNILMTKQNDDILLITQLIAQYADNDFSKDLPPQLGDKAVLNQRMNSVRDRLKESLRDSEINTRVKIALDNASASAMIADVNHTIIYMNNTLKKMFSEMQDDIREVFPEFHADDVIGGSIARFYKSANHQCQLLETITSVHQTKIRFGTKSLNLVITPVFNNEGHRLGTVVEWQDKTLEDAQELKAKRDAEIAVANDRVKMALDSVSIPVRIADNDGSIIYINHALHETLHRFESAFRQQIPNFNADKVVGGNIAMFYADPVAAIERLRNVSGTLNTHMLLGGREYDIITTAVWTESGEKIGTVGQWIDVTEQLNAEREISEVVKLASEGDFSKTLGEADKSGFYLQITKSMNQLIQSCDQGLNEIIRVLSAFSNGDLTQKITVEMSGSFGIIKSDANATSTKLAKIIQDVRNSADALSSASDQVSDTAQSLSKSASDQATGVERTSASVVQMSSSVEQNTENAKVTDVIAAQASKEAISGGKAVSQTVQAMKQIAGKIGIIDDIAYQTNMLALNAAIEAARAGEHGKGFAVVAAEVRKLAERSQFAAKEISELASDSVSISEQAGKLLNDIIPAIGKTSDLVQEISAASTEQSTGLLQISAAMSQLNQATQQNASASEELAATAEELSGQADNLQSLMQFFKLETLKD